MTYVDKQFSKHYNRMIEDLKQIQGFTPVMEKVISFNVNKLKDDVTREANYEGAKDEREEYDI